MRKIIHNKVYDTDTAKLVGHWSASVAVSDFSWYAEDLYRKRTGEYFVYGEGHAASPYRERSYDMWAPGEQIVPVGYDEARRWAEGHLEADEYEAEFGVPEEGEAVISAVISNAAKAAIDRRRAKTGETISQIIDEAVMAACEVETKLPFD